MSYMTVVFDEAGRWLSDDTIKSKVITICSEGRKFGVHAIIGIQRPSSTMMSGDIKANLDTTACFRVRDRINANMLFGDKTIEPYNLKVGELIYKTTRGELHRLTTVNITTQVIKTMVSNMKERGAKAS